LGKGKGSKRKTTFAKSKKIVLHLAICRGDSLVYGGEPGAGERKNLRLGDIEEKKEGREPTFEKKKYFFSGEKRWKGKGKR